MNSELLSSLQGRDGPLRDGRKPRCAHSWMLHGVSLQCGCGDWCGCMRMEPLWRRPCGYCCSASYAMWEDVVVLVDRLLLRVEQGGTGQGRLAERGVRVQCMGLDGPDASRGSRARCRNRKPTECG